MRDRLAMAQCLKNPETQFVLDKLTTPLYASNPNGNLLYANPAFFRGLLKHRTPNKLKERINDNTANLYAEGEKGRERFQKEFKKRKSIRNFETQLNCADGTKVAVVMDAHLADTGLAGRSS